MSEAIRRINTPNLTTQLDPKALRPTKAPLLSLFNQNDFETSAGDGSQADGKSALPSLSDADKEQINSLFAHFTPQQLQDVKASGEALATAALNYVKSTGGKGALSSGVLGDPLSQAVTAQNASTAAASQGQPGVVGQMRLSTQNRSASVAPGALPTADGSGTGSAAPVSPEFSGAAQTAVNTYHQASGGKGNYDDAVAGALYTGVIGLQNQLTTFAKGVNDNTSKLNTVQTSAQALQTQIEEWGNNPDAKQNYEYTTVDPSSGVIKTHDVNGTLADAKASLSGMNSDMTTLNSMNQTDQLQLQNQINQYQQGLTALTNLLKSMHDTTMSIVNNLKI